MSAKTTTTTIGLDWSRFGAAAAAVALGLTLVFISGFAPLEVAHNAAHDARHSFALPCH